MFGCARLNSGFARPHLVVLGQSLVDFDQSLAMLNPKFVGLYQAADFGQSTSSFDQIWPASAKFRPNLGISPFFRIRPNSGSVRANMAASATFRRI